MTLKRCGRVTIQYTGPEPELALFTGISTMLLAVKGYVDGGLPGAFTGAIVGGVMGVACWAIFKTLMGLTMELLRQP